MFKYLKLSSILIAGIFVLSFSTAQACAMFPGKSCCNEPCTSKASAYKDAKLIKVACGVCGAETADTEEVVLNVKGMTCGGCENKVKGALIECAGVKDAHVSHKEGKAVVHVEKGKVDKEKLIEAVQGLGYIASEG
jgi:copper chaperone CopZ